MTSEGQSFQVEKIDRVSYFLIGSFVRVVEHDGFTDVEDNPLWIGEKGNKFGIVWNSLAFLEGKGDPIDEGIPIIALVAKLKWWKRLRMFFRWDGRDIFEIIFVGRFVSCCLEVAFEYFLWI